MAITVGKHCLALHLPGILPADFAGLVIALDRPRIERDLPVMGQRIRE
jgi:hypothetical protein